MHYHWCEISQLPAGCIVDNIFVAMTGAFKQLSTIQTYVPKSFFLLLKIQILWNIPCLLQLIIIFEIFLLLLILIIFIHFTICNILCAEIIFGGLSVWLFCCCCPEWQGYESNVMEPGGGGCYRWLDDKRGYWYIKVYYACHTVFFSNPVNVMCSLRCMAT